MPKSPCWNNAPEKIAVKAKPSQKAGDKRRVGGQKTGSVNGLNSQTWWASSGQTSRTVCAGQINQLEELKKKTALHRYLLAIVDAGMAEVAEGCWHVAKRNLIPQGDLRRGCCPEKDWITGLSGQQQWVNVLAYFNLTTNKFEPPYPPLPKNWVSGTKLLR